VPPRAIFRESAVEAYRRRTERDVLPRVTSRPVIACAWILVGVLLAAALAAWSVRVPRYVAAVGAILAPSDQTHDRGDRTTAVLFLARGGEHRVRVGQRVRVQIASSGRIVEGRVARVASSVVGPAAARRRYQLEGTGAVLTEPSRPVVVRFERGGPAAVYAGTRVTARVHIGSERLLALFPLIGKLVRGGS
jgi:hypothetical protein